MNFTILKHDHDVVIKIGGTVTSIDLNNLLEKMSAGMGASDIVNIDLSKLTELTTATLQVILSIYKDGNQRHKSVQIITASQPVIDVLNYLNLTKLLVRKATDVKG